VKYFSGLRNFKAVDSARVIECYEKLMSLEVYPLGWEAQQAWLADHAELAEAYWARGDRVKARKMLDDFARLWRKADAELPLARRILLLQGKMQSAGPPGSDKATRDSIDK
jgi:hypothetical protein